MGSNPILGVAPFSFVRKICAKKNPHFACAKRSKDCWIKYSIEASSIGASLSYVRRLIHLHG
jgi:hypothetical protein